MATKGQMEQKFSEFDQRLCSDASFWAMSVVEQAAEIGVSKPTLIAWKKRIDWGKVRQSRRAFSGELVCEADVALRKRTNQGDLRAIELTLARHDNWVLKSVSEMALSALGPETKEDTQTLLVGGLLSLPLDEFTEALERAFKARPPEDRQHTISRLGALPAEIVHFDLERAGIMSLPVEVQRLVESKPFGGEFEEKQSPDWGDTARAVSR